MVAGPACADAGVVPPDPSQSPPNQNREWRILTVTGGQTSTVRISGFALIRADFQQRPRQDSNLRTRLRRPMLYPLSYEGREGQGSAPASAGRTENAEPPAEAHT